MDPLTCLRRAAKVSMTSIFVALSALLLSLPAFSDSRLQNIATRAQVKTGDEVLIGGLVISGTEPKTVVIRARGPALTTAGVSGALTNPQMALFSGADLIDSNDDWQTHPNANLIPEDLRPVDPTEAVIVATLQPGPYTAIVSGVADEVGVGLVEIFELTDTGATRLRNIATRGFVGTGDNVMIGGLVINGTEPKKVVVRAKGPSLAEAGVPGVLMDPQMALFSGATVIDSNDNWQEHPNANFMPEDLKPTNAQEAVIYTELAPGPYTAIVSGVGDTTGVGIVEVFEVDELTVQNQTMVAGGTVSVYRLADLANPVEQTTTSSTGALDTSGRFSLSLDAVGDDELVLVTVEGGQVLDVNQDGVLDTPSDFSGKLHALIRKREWTPLSNVNLLTDLAWRAVREQVIAGQVADLAGRLDWATASLLAADDTGEFPGSGELADFNYLKVDGTALGFDYGRLAQLDEQGNSLLSAVITGDELLLAAQSEALFGDSLIYPEPVAFVAVTADVTLPDNRLGVVEADVVVSSMVSDELEIIDGEGSSVLVAEDAEGRTLLLGVALTESSNAALARIAPRSRLAAATNPQRVDVSTRSTALALVMMSIGAIPEEQETEFLARIEANANFESLVTSIDGAFEANPYFLDSLMEDEELVAAIVAVGSEVLQGFVDEINEANLVGADQRSLIIGGESGRTFAWGTPWRSDQPWTWYNDGSVVNILNPPFLAASDDGQFAIGNPSQVNYVLEYYGVDGNPYPDPDLPPKWHLVDNNNSLINKTYNYGAKRTDLSDFSPVVGYMHFGKFGGQATSSKIVVNLLHTLNVVGGVLDVVASGQALFTVSKSVKRNYPKLAKIIGVAGTGLPSCAASSTSFILEVGSSDDVMAAFVDGRVWNDLECAKAVSSKTIDTKFRDELELMLDRIAGETAAKWTNPAGWALIIGKAVNGLVPTVTSLVGGEINAGYYVTWSGHRVVEVDRDDELPVGLTETIARFTARESSPGRVQFDASASVVDASVVAVYDWEFGDGSSISSSEPTVAHDYLASGDFSARLTISDDTGRDNVTASRLVTVRGGSAPVIESLVCTSNASGTVTLNATVSDADDDVVEAEVFEAAYSGTAANGISATAGDVTMTIAYGQATGYVAPRLVVRDAKGLEDAANCRVDLSRQSDLNLIAYLPFDGNGLDQARTNQQLGSNDIDDSCVTYVPGQVGQGAFFDSSCRAEIGGKVITDEGQGSVSFYAIPNDIDTSVNEGDRAYLFAHFTPNSSDGLASRLYIINQNSGDLQFDVVNVAPLSSGIRLKNGETMHVGLTWNLNSFSAYVNGVRVITDEPLATRLTTDVSNPVVGGYVDDRPTRFDGVIDELRIYDVEISPEKMCDLAGDLCNLNASPGDAFAPCDVCPVMVEIPGGTFQMGDLSGLGVSDEKPVHEVTVPAFAMGKYEVTFDEYDAFAKDTDRALPEDEGWGRGTRPVINVSWNDAQAYVAWLSDRSGLSFRLPSESEWEYAARAGTTTEYHFGNGITCEDANFRPSNYCVGTSTTVGSYPANAFALHDVLGNVWEWVQDCYGSYSNAPVDGSAQDGGSCTTRVLRGGSWDGGPIYSRSAGRRGKGAPSSRFGNFGFRVVQDI
ncbi:MAG: SUMF1/EgtB/PvdO family nonheme iron enzyme [Pseudomonadota bacterium]